MLPGLALLWSAIQLSRRRLDPLLARCSRGSTAISLSLWSLDIRTTVCNSLPARILRAFPRLHTRQRPLYAAAQRSSAFWDVGVVACLVGLVVSQVVLLWAGCRAIAASKRSSSTSALSSAAARLLKRAPVPASATADAADSLVFRPLVPGLTSSLSLIPTLLSALVVSQGFHELGHALAAAHEDIPLLSTGVHLVLLVLPTFFVELSPDTLSPLTDLRIASAGVWHNVVLLVGAWLLSQEGAGLGRSFGLMCGIWRTLDEGLLLVEVQQNSPLAGHLSSGHLITHLDDLELDRATSSTSSQLKAWAHYLDSRSSVDPYENMGWCLSTSAFDEGSTDCCAAPAADIPFDTSATPAGGTTLCFLTSPSTSAPKGRQACLDPLTLLPPTLPSLVPPRCIDDESCGPTEGAGHVCARISEEEQVLRIGVREAGPRGSREAATQDEQVRTVLWQGPRASVARQLSVTDLEPTTWLVPLGLFLALERFYSLVISLCMALAFFNLLPLPHLDGAHILSAFLNALSGPELPVTASARGRTGASVRGEADRGLLSRAIRRLGGVGWVARLAERRDRLEPNMAEIGTSTPQTLEQLVAEHRTALNALYAALSPAPQPLVDAHLASLHSTLSAAISTQHAAASAEVAEAEERLAAAWRRVHDWQTALGEPLRPAKQRGDGPLLSLVDEVERIREGMKGRMEERGKRILVLQERLRELADVVGREWLQVELEQAAQEGRWEDLNLKLDRMGELEREVMRCEAEIAHRRELLTNNANEIFALRNELGIHQEGTDTSVADPLDEEILWHLGVGDARQPPREMSPTTENVQRVEAKRKWLEDEKDSRNSLIQTTYDKLYPLWTMLGVTEEEMEDFVNRHMGSTLDVVNAYQDELARMLSLKRTNMSAFIQREREQLTSLWDALYVSHSQRLAQFPALTISVEPTVVWNAAKGCEEEVVSDNVSEELLVAHERERERLEREVEESRPVLERLQKYFEVVEKMKELEAAAADPSRLMDKSRGAAMRLAQEAKDRKRVDRERPKLEAELRVLIPQWEAQHERPFLIDGVGFIQQLDEQIRAEELEKENKKRAKLGGSASNSARALKPQHTGASTMAPLKRQMTGASVRSATSSTSTGPPAPKRLAAGSAAPTPAAARIARPRSVLGDANGTTPHSVAATPVPLKAQMTGRARAGTLSAHSSGALATPLTHANVSAASSAMSAGGMQSGMRIPAAWRSAGGGGAAASPSLGTSGTGLGAARGLLVPQATGGFRPRPSTQMQL